MIVQEKRVSLERKVAQVHLVCQAWKVVLVNQVWLEKKESP